MADPTPGNDFLLGTDDDDEISGGAGNDVIRGGQGDDTLNGDAGNDKLFGGDGDDVMNGGTGDDVLKGDAGDDLLKGGSGADTLMGGIGDDTLDGGSGADVLLGGDGADDMRGGSGDDNMSGDAGDDTMEGGSGADTLTGGTGNDQIAGGSGDDVLVGGAGDDLIDGGSGNNTVGFSGNIADYTLTRLDDGTIVVKGIAGAGLGDGTDRIVNVDQLQFADGSIDASTITAPCFAAGTRIRTARGEVAVEELVIGDMVMTLEGAQTGFAPVTWIGHRRVDLARHRWPDLVRPVLVRAGALAEHVPARDLLVSPEHALAMDGALVPAALLANGRSIVQLRGHGSITYYHVELPRHAVLFAEGAPAESYLDVGNRFMFENGGALMAMHPRFDAPEAVDAAWCAPRLDAGPKLAALRARLMARAEARFRFSQTADAGLQVVADGRALRPQVEGNRWSVSLPAGTREVRILSHDTCPAAQAADWAGDRRALGVAIGGITLRGADGQVVVVPMQDASLTRGWHAAEEGHRWTDGDALLPARWLEAFGGEAVTLELSLCASLRYWQEVAAPGQIAA